MYKYATLHKNYISYQKTLMESAATTVFDRKMSQDSSFKKDCQFTSNIFNVM